MDSRRLTSEQIEQMRAVMLRQSRYLHRLVERMHDLKWRSEDPLWQSACGACNAVDEMLRHLVVRRKPGGRLP